MMAGFLGVSLWAFHLKRRQWKPAVYKGHTLTVHHIRTLVCCIPGEIRWVRCQGTSYTDARDWGLFRWETNKGATLTAEGAAVLAGAFLGEWLALGIVPAWPEEEGA
jgi:hypothetical protein